MKIIIEINIKDEKTGKLVSDAVLRMMYKVFAGSTRRFKVEKFITKNIIKAWEERKKISKEKN